MSPTAPGPVAALASQPFALVANNRKDQAFTFPSPPASISSSSESGAFDLDFEAFSHISPEINALLEPLPIGDKSLSQHVGIDFDINQSLELSPVASTCTPNSTTLVSPRSSIVESLPLDQLPLLPVPENLESEADAAEALSNHHLQRYLHYKALAARAEADRAVAQQTQDNQIDAFFQACEQPDLFMPGPELPSLKETNNMLAYQPQPVPVPSFYGMGPQVGAWSSAPASFTYHPQSSQAALHHAQAQAHLQAADAARAQAQHSRSLSMSNYYMPSSTRTSFDVAQQQQQQQLGSFARPTSSALSSHSPPYPSTPTYPGVPSLVPMQMSKTSTSTSLPSFASAAPSPLVQRSYSNEHEHELEGEDELGDDYSPPRAQGLEELKPIIPGMPIPNAHGGGRGYVPGQTPDDPKKRHKCQICGRGFARAFNLKSHVQTHNPLRPKPYQCPHPSCKRGFSRLHDLERHRQGIHSDGPLVEAKRHGVTPSVARAQTKMQKRAESGSLI
ncbi:hypothetical protein IAU59_004953 [Kwoniella sp. CBS 9459]